MAPVEKTTVFEIFIQLYNERFLPGMDVVESETFQNMTDQMMHLVNNFLCCLHLRKSSSLETRVESVKLVLSSIIPNGKQGNLQISLHILNTLEELET